MRSASYYAKQAETQLDIVNSDDSLSMTVGEKERCLKVAHIYALLAGAAASQRGARG